MFKGISKGWLRFHKVFSVYFVLVIFILIWYNIPVYEPVYERVRTRGLPEPTGYDESERMLIYLASSVAAFLSYWISVLIGVWIKKGFKEDKK